MNRADDEDDGDYEDDGDIKSVDYNDVKVDDARVCTGSSDSTEREVCATEPCPG